MEVQKMVDKAGVGKFIGGRLYVHSSYAKESGIPSGQLTAAKAMLNKKFPDFEYQGIMYDKKLNLIRFDAADGFDTEREPVVGSQITVNLTTGAVTEGGTPQIWHHKWQWVKPDYTGFNYAAAKDWSETHVKEMPETPSGYIDKWEEQLARYDKGRNMLVPDPVVSTGRWKPGPSFAKVKAMHPSLFAGEEDVAHNTQIAGTKATYQKIGDLLKSQGFTGTILDASSGKGLGKCSATCSRMSKWTMWNPTREKPTSRSTGTTRR